MKLPILVLLLASLLAAQVPRPQIPLTGNIGAQGPFPLLNNGTIVMATDANYAMTYPDMSASVLRVTSSVPLTATRSIIAPQARGFQFTVENATTGGQSILVIGTGAGVTIPNGQTMLVVSDGTNYVSAVGGAAGFRVPTDYLSIQGAVTAATAAGNMPVTVEPYYTGTDSFTNPTGLRVNDRRLQNGIDSGFSRDAREWGVKADGKVVQPCTATAGSPVLNCSTANFQAGDVGKVARASGALPGIGASTGRITGFSVVSGGSGGTNGLQLVTFTGLTGCTSAFNLPIVYVNVVGGVPQPGAVTQNPGGYGIGCTSIPTSGTVATVTGTVTFSGGHYFYGDLPTSIVSVSTPTQITMADNATQSSTQVALIYGSDDNDGTHNNWNTACNAMGSGGYAMGHLTFSGISLITHGISCLGASLKIQGAGVSTYAAGGGSTLLYVGKTTGDAVIKFSSGYNAELSKMRIDGNSLALPNGLQMEQGTGGGLPNAFGWFHDMWFGSFFNDAGPGNYAVVPELANCVYAHAATGNNDFNTLERVGCMGVKNFADTNNNQATNWNFGKIQSVYNEIGFVCWGTSMHTKELYTEFNRLDIMNGSPTNSNAYPVSCKFDVYGGESSAEHFMESPLYAGGDVEVDDATGLSESGCSGQCLQAGGVSVDLSNYLGGNFTWHGTVPGTVLIRGGCSGSGSNFDFAGMDTSKITYYFAPNPTCNDLFRPNIKITNPNVRGQTTAQVDLDILQSNAPIAQDLEHDNPYTKILGSLDVTNPDPPNPAYLGVVNKGTAGSTKYTYQLTCVDNGGYESQYQAVQTLTGNATLSTSNFNEVYWYPSVKCPLVNLYGDEGSGAIGYLTQLRVTTSSSDSSVGFNNVYIADKGQYTKDTTHAPPSASVSGVVNANGFQQKGVPYSTYFLNDWNHADTSQYDGDVPRSFNGNYWTSAFLFPNQTGIPGVTSGGGSIQWGYTVTATTGLNALQNVMYMRPITITQNTLANDMVLIFTSNTGAAATAVVGIYKANGRPLAGFPYNQPGILVCQSSVFTPSVGTNTITLPGCKLSAGSTYHMFLELTGVSGSAVEMEFDSLGGPPPDTMACAILANLNNVIPANITSNPNLSCQLSSPPGAWPTWYVDGTLQPSLNANNFTATNPIPANLLGTGSTGAGTNCLKDNQSWGSCSGTGGAPYPPAGVPNSTGSAWGTSYGFANPFPANFLGSGGTGTGSKCLLDNQTFGACGGSGAVALSALTGAIVANPINNGSFAQTWKWNFTGTTINYGLRLSESTASTNSNAFLLQADTLASSAATPFKVTAGGLSNGVEIDPATGNLLALGTAKLVGPVQMPAIVSAPALATDGSGNIIASTVSSGGPAYVQAFAGVQMVGTAGPIALTGPGCSGSTCTAITPSVDTSYRLAGTITQTAPGSGCSGTGSLQFWLTYTDPDNNPNAGYVVTNVPLPASPISSGTWSPTMNMGNAANGAVNMFNIQPTLIRVKAGASLSFRVQQTVVASTCTTQPTFTIRLAFY